MGYNARYCCSSFRTTPRNALPIASKSLPLTITICMHHACFSLHSPWQCTVFMWPQLPRDIGLTTSRIPPQLALRIPFHLGKPLLHNTQHTHHDHAHCDSHSTAGCLHRTASSYYLVSVHAQCVREDQTISCVNSTANRNTRHTNKYRN